MDFATPQELYQHYQTVAHRLGNKHYIYPVQPIAKAVSRPVKVVAASSVTKSVVEAVALPTPDEFWDKMQREHMLKSIQNARRMVKCIAAKHKMPDDDLYGTRRHYPIVAARKEAYYWLVRKFGMSLPMVGKIMNRDHTTVLSGVREYEAGLAEKCQPV